MHIFTAGQQSVRAYSAMSTLGAQAIMPSLPTGLEAIRQSLSRTHLRGDAFSRLLENPAIGLDRLQGVLTVVVRETLDVLGIDADAAVLVREGEPGYGWTNGGWVLSQLEAELGELFNAARQKDQAFARALARATVQREAFA